MDKNIFKRVNLQQISSFILFREETATSIESYEERLQSARKTAFDALKDVKDGKMDDLSAQDNLIEAFEIYEETCVEIGMKLGARMLSQLLHKDSNPDNNSIFK